MKIKKYISFSVIAILLMSLITACQDDDSDTLLQNDCIKRTIGPNVVGLDMEFAYAMALPPSAGKMISAQVTASIAGASGTWMEHNSYYTNGSGVNVPVPVGNPSTTNGEVTEVVFSKDTCASTLRYYYIIPEEARGKSVSFTFSAKSSNGENISYNMGPYTIANMDMKLDLVATDATNCYISIADMVVYDAAVAATNPEKIDLVYLYRSIPNITFLHALAAPAAESQYLPGITLPPGVSNNTLIKKVYGLRDRHLARLQYGIYVDDPDFETLVMDNMPNYATNMKNEGGIWIETQDGKYRAYIFLNEVNPGSSGTTIPANSVRFSIKRYRLK